MAEAVREKTLRHALRAALSRVTVAALLCGTAIWMNSVAAARREAVLGALIDFRQTVARTHSIKAARALYQTRYHALLERGLIGEQQRLAIVEGVQRAAAELGLRDVTFELAPTTVTGELQRGLMTLRAGVVHEAELMRLLTKLHGKGAALWVRHCSVERSGGDESRLLPDNDNLRAECELEWQTVRLAP